VNADPKQDTGDSHAPVPFYVTSEGIGIFVDTARYVTFYFGNARPKPGHSSPAFSASSVDPNYTHNLQNSDTGRVTIEAANDRRRCLSIWRPSHA
jgi:alpha-glucosidase (family GH31 glycosyl hydrolase)